MAEVAYMFNCTGATWKRSSSRYPCLSTRDCASFWGRSSRASMSRRALFRPRWAHAIVDVSSIQKEQLLAEVPEETDDNQDEVFWALVQADWAMLDALVDHSAGTAATTRARITASCSISASS